MKIRTRLAIQFTLIVATLLFVFASAIYYFASTYRENDFYERLSEKALNYGKLSIEVDDPHLVEVFDKNTIYLHNEKIIVFDASNHQIFNTHHSSASVDPEKLREAREKKEIRYTNDENEVLAMLYPSVNKHEFVVVVSAHDKTGLNQLNNLKIILIAGLFICVLVTVIAGWLYARQALHPIALVIEQVEKITASNLSERVDQGNGKDEIGRLALTFNNMLARIQKAFEVQRSFVSNSSHELRTPLTSITGQLEVALMSSRKPEEYEHVLQSVLEDIRNLNKLANSLLELAQAGMDSSAIQMQSLRIDELLWKTRNEILKSNSEFNIRMEVTEFPQDEHLLTIKGNMYLLRIALVNIIENACKFSPDNSVHILFKVTDAHVQISFLDKGIGITKEELAKISEPFYRGTNAKEYPGHGLGLALTFRIIDLHKGRLRIDSKVNEYTHVDIVF
jgi:signal transduction histidine kinase